MNQPLNRNVVDRADRDFARVDTTTTLPLLTKGRYAAAFTDVVKLEARHGLILLPADIAIALKAAGIKKVPEVIPDLRARFALPRFSILGSKQPDDRNAARILATGQEVMDIFTSLKEQADPSLADAMREVRDNVPRMSFFSTPYYGAEDDVGARAWMHLPLRTLIRAVGNPGRIYTHGQGFCLVPRVAVPNPTGQGVASFIPTKQLIVGLCRSLRVRGDKGPSGNEWLAVINSLELGSSGQRASIVDTIFSQLFQDDLNDDDPKVWEAEKRSRRKGPLLQMFVDALRAGSDVYDRLIVAEPDAEEEGSEAAQRELKRRFLVLRPCDKCRMPLRTPTSPFCQECGAEQKPRTIHVRTGDSKPEEKAVAPAEVVKDPAAPQAVAASPVQPAPVEGKPAEVKEDIKPQRVGPPCPHDPTHKLRKDDSKFCDLCAKPVPVTVQPELSARPAAVKPDEKAVAPAEAVKDPAAPQGVMPLAQPAAPVEGKPVETKVEEKKPEERTTSKIEVKHLWCDTAACENYHKVVYTSQRTCDKCGNAITREKSSDGFMLQVREMEATRAGLGQSADKWAKTELKKFAERQQKAANASSASPPDNSVAPPSAASSTPSAT